MREDIDPKKYQALLEAEKDTLEDQLPTIAQPNPDNKEDWVATPEEDNDGRETDQLDRAEDITAFENNAAITHELEGRLESIKAALKKIDENSFGMCEVCNEPIEVERLDVNPASRNCVLHMND